MRYKC